MEGSGKVQPRSLWDGKLPRRRPSPLLPLPRPQWETSLGLQVTPQLTRAVLIVVLFAAMGIEPGSPLYILSEQHVASPDCASARSLS